MCTDNKNMGSLKQHVTYFGCYMFVIILSTGVLAQTDLIIDKSGTELSHGLESEKIARQICINVTNSDLSTVIEHARKNVTKMYYELLVQQCNHVQSTVTSDTVLEIARLFENLMFEIRDELMCAKWGTSYFGACEGDNANFQGDLKEYDLNLTPREIMPRVLTLQNHCLNQKKVRKQDLTKAADIADGFLRRTFCERPVPANRGSDEASVVKFLVQQVTPSMFAESELNPSKGVEDPALMHRSHMTTAKTELDTIDERKEKLARVEERLASLPSWFICDVKGEMLLQNFSVSCRFFNTFAIGVTYNYTGSTDEEPFKLQIELFLKEGFVKNYMSFIDTFESVVIFKEFQERVKASMVETWFKVGIAELDFSSGFLKFIKKVSVPLISTKLETTVSALILWDTSKAIKHSEVQAHAAKYEGPRQWAQFRVDMNALMFTLLDRSKATTECIYCTNSYDVHFPVDFKGALTEVKPKPTIAGTQKPTGAKPPRGPSTHTHNKTNDNSLHKLPIGGNQGTKPKTKAVNGAVTSACASLPFLITCAFIALYNAHQI